MHATGRSGREGGKDFQAALNRHINRLRGIEGDKGRGCTAHVIPDHFE